MEILKDILDIFLHLDTHLNQWADQLGPWLYVLLFLVVFCETGLVVTPFLPGDSLLFAVGALAATPGSPLQVVPLSVLLIVAAILGDAVNYSIGLRVGPRVFEREGSRFFKRDHLLKAQAFYELHGGKTIILARFVPIVRTFAPFVAGIGRMSYRRFAMFNVVGGVVWVVLFIGAGYAFGNVPVVKRNFQYVIIAIILVSMLPGLVEFMRARAAKRAARP
jgi:membrane-associated protein